MASPCEVQLEVRSQRLARRLLDVARREALRIERLLSRYRDDNVVHRINHAEGRALSVDSETARMLDFADTCFHLSQGRFDVTSGVLREAWHFDGSDRIPSREQVQALLPRIGWQQVNWQKPQIRLPAGMQIDLGGIGKEYAVDSTLTMLESRCPGACLVNFGGDLRASGPPLATGAWMVGLERADSQDSDESTCSPARTLELERGALATSGDARRYLLCNGVRYSHVLDPRTGWPVPNAPSSVTVAADTCIEAGMLATMALLHGADAEQFLQAQSADYWLQR